MIYTSPYRPLGELKQTNVIDQFFDLAERKDDDPAFTDFPGTKTLTNKQAQDSVYKFAHTLKTDYNIRQNDVVMLSTLNSMYLQTVHFGTLLLGGIISPSNIMYTSEELAHQVRSTKPKLLIASDFNLKVVEGALKLAEHNCQVVTISEVETLVDKLIADSSAPRAKAASVNASTQHAYYCFSSGTSGLPKGVITTQQNIWANTLQQDAIEGVTANSGNTIAAPLPMSHIYGLNAFLWALPFTGKHLIVFPKFDFEQVVKAIIHHKINVLFGVPPIVVGMAKSPALAPLADKISEHLRVFQSGAAPLTRETVAVFNERFPSIKIVQGYGMTEMSPVSHSVGESTHSLLDPSSVGWLISSTEMRLVDAETLKDVPKGQRGEVWIRGPQVMQGYLNNKAATDECLSSDGWLRTGDVGLVDDTGMCYIVDRIKELIKSKGHQVAPAELEGLLLQHKNVTDAVVVGVPSDDGSTERPRAYVVLEPGVEPTEVVKWFNKRVSIHKRLWGGLVVVKEVAKNPSGKILRKEYRGRKDTEVWGESMAKL